MTRTTIRYDGRHLVSDYEQYNAHVNQWMRLSRVYLHEGRLIFTMDCDWNAAAFQFVPAIKRTVRQK